MHVVLAVGNQGCSADTCVVIAGDLSPVSLLALGSAGCPQHLHHTRHWTATQSTLGQDNRINMHHGRLQNCMCTGMQHCAILVTGQPPLTLLEKSNWQGSDWQGVRCGCPMSKIAQRAILGMGQPYLTLLENSNWQGLLDKCTYLSQTLTATPHDCCKRATGKVS